MSMGKREGKQEPMWIGVGEMPRSAGHRFYEKLNELLGESDFDRKVGTRCTSPILVTLMWSRQSGFHVEGRDVGQTGGGVAGERAELDGIL